MVEPNAPNEPPLFIAPILAAYSVKDKADLHKACVRNRFYVPSLRARITTVPFLNEIKNETVYAVRINDIRPHCCPDPPRTETVRQELQQTLERILDGALVNELIRQPLSRLRDYLVARPADREWMLNMLYHFSEGNHAYWAREYVRPREPNQAPQFHQALVMSDKGFFTGLPQTNSKSKRSVVNKMA